MAKGAGKLITDTPLGGALDMIDGLHKLPQPIWEAASRVFAANAKGEVQAFMRDPAVTGIWSSIEKPTLNFMNKINVAVTGSPATVVKYQ
jgi:hypothetical protein